MKTLTFILAFMFTLPLFSQNGFYYNKKQAQIIQQKIMANGQLDKSLYRASKKQKQKVAKLFGIVGSTDNKQGIILAKTMLQSMVISGTISKKENNIVVGLLQELAQGKNINKALKDHPIGGFVGSIFQDSGQQYTSQGLFQNIRRAINKIAGAFIGNNVGGAWGYVTGGVPGMVEGGMEGAKKGMELGGKLSDLQDGAENGGGSSFMIGPDGADCTRPAGWPAH